MTELELAESSERALLEAPDTGRNVGILITHLTDGHQVLEADGTRVGSPPGNI